jgi:hypothetical protein
VTVDLMAAKTVDLLVVKWAVLMVIFEAATMVDQLVQLKGGVKAVVMV